MKKLTARFLVLFTLAFAAQLPVGHLLDGKPFDARDRLDRGLAEKADVVYLGDSVLESAAAVDADQRNIAQMIDGRSVVLVSHAGYGMEVYLRFAEYLARQALRPKALVVPVNLRSFSALWPYSFELERLRLGWGDLLGVGLYRPLTGLKLLPSPPPAGPALRSGEEFLKAAYGIPLRPGHPRLQALRKLTDVCLLGAADGLIVARSGCARAVSGAFEHHADLVAFAGLLERRVREYADQRNGS